MFLLRVADGQNNLMIDWNFQFNEYTAAEIAANKLLKLKQANFILPDPKQTSALYLVGRYRGLGSVIRFNKRDGTVRWHAQFNKMSRINSVSQSANDDDIFICGDYQPNEKTDVEPYDSKVLYKATMARLKDDGDVSWIITASGRHPLYDNGVTYNHQDKCMAITYYKEKEQLAVIIQGKMSEVRPNYKGNYYDTILVQMDSGGTAQKVVVITQGSLGYDMYTAKNGIFFIGDNMYFSGWSYGFETERQTLKKSTTSPDYDVYIYKYRFGQTNTCLRLFEAEYRTIQRNMEFTQSSQVESTGLYSFTTAYRSIPMNKEDNYFLPYQSRYSGGFALLDTMKIPRPCAFASQNLTSVQYYRGQNTKQYNLFAENSAKVASYMTGTPKIIYQNGQDASNLAKYNRQANTIDIFTNNDDVGIKKTIIRSCDSMNRLLEMNLYIEVLANTYPDFVSEPETSFVLAVNEVYQYELPAVKDPEGNDEPEVYVGYMEQQEDKYPEFLYFTNSTNTIKFNPDSKKYAGRTYYFTIVVKEKHSDSVKYSFYATVRVTGDSTEQANQAYVIGGDNAGKTEVNYTITYVDDKGKGSMKFTSPIHMKWVEEHFNDFFKIYWRDTDYRKTKENLQLLDFKPTNFSADAMTIDFEIRFSKPYRVGLLVKKSDRLHIDVQMEESQYNGTYGLWLGDPKTYVLGTTAAKIRLELIFDFDNEVMATFRSTAKNMYWVIIGLIILQFILLLIRGVGLLPVWVFIEYLQLVAFMPIYNFRLIPYLYDAFKPALVSHMIIFDDTPFIEDMDSYYFNQNYEYYWLSVGKMFQAFFFVCVLLVLIILANIIVFAIYKANCSNVTLNSWAARQMTQFKFNVYIRFYMLVYFDTTFFSVMKILEKKENDTVLRKAALLVSYIIFVVNIVLPVFLIAHINRKFEILAMKEAKQSFNTLLLKIDKASRWRIINPAYFFARRLLTAMLLTLPIDNTFIFLQYVFILMSSHAYVLYMVAVKPFQTPGINSYVLASETFYSALIIAIFIFSDATPEMSIKFGAGVALIVSLIMLVVSNVIMNIYYMVQGPVKIKKAIKESTLKRAEKEALERAEEEERKLKKKKEEEEFTKIPDETMNMSSIDASNTTQQNNTMSELNNAGKKRAKGGKNAKKKGTDDNLAEAGLGGLGQDDF